MVKKKAYDILSSIELVEAAGSKQFLKKSQHIYGSPSFVLRDGKTSSLNLAKSLSL